MEPMEMAFDEVLGWEMAERRERALCEGMRRTTDTRLVSAKAEIEATVRAVLARLVAEGEGEVSSDGLTFQGWDGQSLAVGVALS